MEKKQIDGEVPSANLDGVFASDETVIAAQFE